jgi:hypothetical protein
MNALYCVVFGEARASALQAQKISVRLLLVGGKYMKELIYSVPIDAIEVLTLHNSTHKINFEAT